MLHDIVIDEHEWIDDITTVLIYYLENTHPRE